MISYLKGKILGKGQNFAVVEVSNVGYKVFLNPTALLKSEAGKEIELFTHQYVREDALDLYGFKTPEELEFFELLLSISGIGPKSALGVLAIASVANIKESISRGDPSLLTKVSGIGRKTAERVVLELREKIDRLSYAGKTKAGDGAAVSGEEIDALMALGYSMTQARESLKQVDSKIKDSGERIRQALKKMGR
ncbi:MAG: Holliday junction branch migration protein RuvA [Patescibacteria group bacterium]|nr:Holliday junction branch migration protein RuvA [Patescibacteria group bacterium]